MYACTWRCDDFIPVKVVTATVLLLQGLFFGFPLPLWPYAFAHLICVLIFLGFYRPACPWCVLL